MKLDEIIPEAGRPIAYYPRLRQIAGSTNAAILLCQLIYWTGKQRDPDGWIQKRAKPGESTNFGPFEQSLADETGMTYDEELTARRLLRPRGLIKERLDRVNHCVYFRVDLEVLKRAWAALRGRQERIANQVGRESHPGQGANAIPPGSQRHPGGLAKPSSINGINTDHAEPTPESSSREAPATPPGEGSLDSDPEEIFNLIPTTPAEALHHPSIRLFREVCGRMPGEKQYRTVIELMNHFRQLNGEDTVEFLRPFWLAWSSRRRKSDGQPYDPASLTWLSEWALNGTIPPDQGGMHGSAERNRGSNPSERRGPALSPEQLAALERLNAEARQSRLPDL